MAFSKIIFNGVTQMDVTGDTVAADNLLTGYTATGADGEPVVGAYVPSGGGVQEVESGVLFVDYDGELVDAWEAADVAGKTALPSNPSHTDIGLTSQGWNWTLADVKSYIQTYPTAVLTVGQVYTTISGASEIDITIDSTTLNPYLGICPNGTITVDWGDNSATSTLTGTSTSTLKWANHTYATVGNYTIKLIPTTGTTYHFKGTDGGKGSIISETNSFTAVLLYASCVTAVRMGTGSGFETAGMAGLRNVNYVTVPNGVTAISQTAFSNHRIKKAVIIPSGVTSIGNNGMNSNYAVKYISLPNSMTTFGTSSFADASSAYAIAVPTGVTTLPDSVFQGCRALKHMTFPNGLTTIGQYVMRYCDAVRAINFSNTITAIGQSAFWSCFSLEKLVFPTGVTSAMNTSLFYQTYNLEEAIIQNGVTSIGSSAFYNSTSLMYVTLPNSVSTINSQAFYGCRSMVEFRFARTTAPTVSATSAWTSVPTSCLMLIPVGALASYLSASNYPSKTSYTYLGYGTYTSGETLPAQDSTQAYNLTWYASKTDAKAQSNPITQGNGFEVYCRYVAV